MYSYVGMYYLVMSMCRVHSVVIITFIEKDRLAWLGIGRPLFY